MKNNKLIIIILTSIVILLVSFISFKLYRSYKIKHATKIVELVSNEVEVYSNIYLKDIIKNINGKLITNPRIKTSKIGKIKVAFSYITDEDIKVPFTVELKIVDKTPPIISMQNNLTVTVGSKIDISKELFCGDNYDSNPKCIVEGEYNLDVVGNYPLKFIGIDSSNNETSHDFTLVVKEKTTSKNKNTSPPKSTSFQEIVKKYKTKDTKIGIDVSHWQGDIDFEKVKKEKVEFVYIRIGRGNGIGKDYVLDSKFKQNIKGFNDAGIPVGIYFYSNANSKKDAIKEAKWILKEIKDYKVDLEIVFDWENWDSFQEYNLSFKKLTELSDTFVKTVEQVGYKGMLYSSKSYLENIWYPVKYATWLAHYTSETDYKGKYKVWQICSNGKVSGIDDNLVDINILYQ